MSKDWVIKRQFRLSLIASMEAAVGERPLWFSCYFQVALEGQVVIGSCSLTVAVIPSDTWALFPATCLFSNLDEEA